MKEKYKKINSNYFDSLENMIEFVIGSLFTTNQLKVLGMALAHFYDELGDSILDPNDLHYMFGIIALMERKREVVDRDKDWAKFYHQLYKQIRKETIRDVRGALVGHEPATSS